MVVNQNKTPDPFKLAFKLAEDFGLDLSFSVRQ
jgi:hypothetical protein